MVIEGCIGKRSLGFGGSTAEGTGGWGDGGWGMVGEGGGGR